MPGQPMTAAEHYEAANRAEADAIRWRRTPGGECLAELRRQDAATLRAKARELLLVADGKPKNACNGVRRPGAV